jgi:hypothetical protein
VRIIAATYKAEQLLRHFERAVSSLKVMLPRLIWEGGILMKKA